MFHKGRPYIISLMSFCCIQFFWDYSTISCVDLWKKCSMRFKKNGGVLKLLLSNINGLILNKFCTNQTQFLFSQIFMCSPLRFSVWLLPDRIRNFHPIWFSSRIGQSLIRSNIYPNTYPSKIRYLIQSKGMEWKVYANAMQSIFCLKPSGPI